MGLLIDLLIQEGDHGCTICHNRTAGRRRVERASGCPANQGAVAVAPLPVLQNPPSAAVLDGDDGLFAGSGTLHALGFWFELLLTDERERGAALSTGPGAAEGREGKDDHARLPSSFRQGAVLLAEARAVQAGQTVHVEIVCSLSRGIDVVLVEPR